MSNEKMREEFESWYRKNHAWPPESDPLEKVGGEYVFGPIRYRWQTWQASRAAIEVELPKIVGFEGAYDSIQNHEFVPLMSDIEDADEIFGLIRSIEVREAIESLGLKVKS
jgi:hypothetical protein